MTKRKLGERRRRRPRAAWRTVSGGGRRAVASGGSGVVRGGGRKLRDDDDDPDADNPDDDDNDDWAVTTIGRPDLAGGGSRERRDDDADPAMTMTTPTTSGRPDPVGGGGRERRDDDPNDDPDDNDDWAATGRRRGPRPSRIRRRRASSCPNPVVAGLVLLGSGESGGGRRWEREREQAAAGPGRAAVGAGPEIATQQPDIHVVPAVGFAAQNSLLSLVLIGGAEEAEDVICDSGSPAVTIVLLTVYSKFPMGLRVSRGM
uniref:Uncharacterized protein n=1 Tax=Oryza sativa subsp. japonica TaxID=39947 RepID=Q75LL4_ORYSJ|nr:hypothetical protein [Oryza sativa Japonica Group]